MKKNIVSTAKGFTLTEVLLAVMIVGLIGVALASLSRGAARESSVGRSRITLRNDLSLFIRQLRSDLETASAIAPSGTPDAAGGKLLTIKQGNTRGESAIWTYAKAGLIPNQVRKDIEPKKWITYCFKKGTVAAKAPTGSTVQGEICRIASTESEPACTNSACATVLTNVKYIPDTYPVPLFRANPRFGSNVLDVHIITELNSNPVANETIEEIFPIPGGYIYSE